MKADPATGLSSSAAPALIPLISCAAGEDLKDPVAMAHAGAPACPLSATQVLKSRQL